MKNKWINISIFILSLICLIISLKIFWNIGIYVDNFNTSPDVVLGGIIMFINILKAEKLKLHNSSIWLAFFIIPCISAFMGTFNYSNNTEVLKEAWYSLWTQHTLFYCYFCFPALIGVYCAYECRLENMNNNWNMVLTMPVRKTYIFLAKFITIYKVVFITQILVGLLFIISGKICGFTEIIPSRFLLLLILGSIGSMPVIALQLLFSLKIKNFAVPVGISMIGGILGLVFRAKGLGLYFPYSLFSTGMCANDPLNIDFSIIAFIISCIVFSIIFSIIGISMLGKENK